MTDQPFQDNATIGTATAPPGSTLFGVAISRRLSSGLAFLLLTLAMLAGAGTYAAFTGIPPFGGDAETLVIMVYLDLALLGLLAIVIARRVVALWSDRRRGSAGSRLHVRLVALFSALSVTPAIVVSLFSLLFFDLGVESWFSERVRTAVTESREVAEAYLIEHRNTIRTDALRTARDLNRDVVGFQLNPPLLTTALDLQRRVRDLSEAMVFRGADRQILAKSGITMLLELEPVGTAELQAAAGGEVVLLTSSGDDRVRALLKLDGFADAYLIIGRLVERQVLVRIDQVRDAADAFERLESERTEIQLSFALAFVVVALLLLLTAIWIGLTFATQLSAPISALIGATERISTGDLDARVEEVGGNDELALLSRAFNRMTTQLDTQRRELTEASRQIDERRRFSEAVLSGVSAGVVGMDQKGRINLPNRRASALLGLAPELLIGEPLTNILPELKETMEAATSQTDGRAIEAQISLSEPGFEARTLFVRIVAERDDSVAGEEGIQGFVATFDDVSPLLAAQRKAAWADVARRIAHEIKNPLTPIQLSAERLKRKYRKEITSDPHVFEACIDTIVRQVDDIGRMVTEFSSFARMPAPTMRNEDILDLCRQSLFLQRTAHTETEYSFEGPDQPILVRCDGRQLSQVFTNLLQNAQDAIDGRETPEDENESLRPGRITLSISCDDRHVSVAIQDNGKGLPAEQRDRLTEPYVTTRKKGTGLGLAIVKKILEDHGGGLTLEDAPDGGAIVTARIAIGVILEDNVGSNGLLQEDVGGQNGS